MELFLCHFRSFLYENENKTIGNPKIMGLRKFQLSDHNFLSSLLRNMISGSFS